jgi:hypothetical protein
MLPEVTLYFYCWHPISSQNQTGISHWKWIPMFLIPTSEMVPLTHINPLPSLTLQSARDLNVLCRPKRSKVLLLSYTFKCPLQKMQFFCPCSRALNRSGKGLIINIKALLYSVDLTETALAVLMISTSRFCHPHTVTYRHKLITFSAHTTHSDLLVKASDMWHWV